MLCCACVQCLMYDHHIYANVYCLLFMNRISLPHIVLWFYITEKSNFTIFDMPVMWLWLCATNTNIYLLEMLSFSCLYICIINACMWFLYYYTPKFFAQPHLRLLTLVRKCLFTFCGSWCEPAISEIFRYRSCMNKKKTVRW